MQNENICPICGIYQIQKDKTYCVVCGITHHNAMRVVEDCISAEKRGAEKERERAIKHMNYMANTASNLEGSEHISDVMQDMAKAYEEGR